MNMKKIRKILITPHYAMETKVEESFITQSDMMEELKFAKQAEERRINTPTTIVIEGEENYTIYILE
jgi:hypothetical protein